MPKIPKFLANSATQAVAPVISILALMLFRFCLYGFLKNQRYFEPFLMLVFLDRGFSFFVIGLLIAARDLTVNLLEIPSGAMADSFGRRGSMVVSFVAYIISFLVLGAATQLPWFFLGMILYGVGDSFRTGTHKAMIFEWLRLQGQTDQRTRVYGFTRSWSQIGSAVSGIIAAAFVLISGSYHFVFYFATIPYILNLANLATYPAALNGDHAKVQSVGESIGRLKHSVVKSVASKPLRRLMLESMGWEGLGDAVKDYLQPVLAVVALAYLARGWTTPELTSTGSPLNDVQSTALLVGPVYAVLFLLSAWASRNAQRWVEWSGSEAAAARNLWATSVFVYGLIGIGAVCQLNGLLVVAFVLLNVLTNVWRPILITRFDSHSDPQEGATILSIESQSQRLATLVLAPMMGGWIDLISEPQNGIELWPVGMVGGVIATILFLTARTNKET